MPRSFEARDREMDRLRVETLPYSRAGTRDVVEHVRDQETNELIGYSSECSASTRGSRAPIWSALACTKGERYRRR